MSEAVRAIQRVPTGFSDKPDSEHDVTIHGYVYGHSRDAFGSNRPGDCVLAIYTREDGKLRSDPIRQFEIRPLPSEEERR
jgi:hypothetical protein